MDIFTSTLRTFLSQHPRDAARELEGQSEETLEKVLRDVGPSIAAKVISQMSALVAVRFVQTTSEEFVFDVVREMNRTDLVSLLRLLDNATQKKLLKSFPEEEVSRIAGALEYPEGTAVSLMDPGVLGLPGDLSVEEAWNQFRKSSHHALYYVYVVDRDRRLLGVISLRELANGKPDQKLTSLMNKSVSRLKADTSHSEVRHHPGWADFHCLPVVDKEGQFLGAIRFEVRHRLDQAGILASSNSQTQTGAALGELYWVGFSALLRGVLNAFSSSSKKQG